MLQTIKWIFLFSLSASLSFARGEIPDSSVTLGAPAPDQEPAMQWNPQWSAFMGGINSSQGKDNGATALLGLHAKFEYVPLSWLTMHLEPGADLYAGRVQQRFEDDTYQSKVWLSDSYVGIRPVQNFEIRGGAIGQNYLSLDEDHENSLIVCYYHAFPGAQEILSAEFGKIKVKAIAEQVVPTSYSLNTQRLDREALPSFQTQTLHVEGESFDRLKWAAMAGHFSWRNIPDAVAADSEIAGNTAATNDAEAVPGSRLKYGFDGMLWGWNAEFEATRRVSLVAGYQGLINTEAPSSSGHGQGWSIGPEVNFNRQSLSFLYTGFFLEADATVAAYARPAFGYANRQGGIVDIDWAFKDKGISLLARWVNARPILDRNTQQVWNYFELGVETKYAPF